MASETAKKIMQKFASRTKNPRRVTAGSFGQFGKTGGGAAAGAGGSGPSGATWGAAKIGAEMSIPQQIKDQINKVFTNKQIQKYGGIVGIVFALSQMARGAVGGGMEHFEEMDLMEQQADLITPESYYQRAMLPQLQEQERGAKQAVLGRLASGGVLGPSLASGEYSIGG